MWLIRRGSALKVAKPSQDPNMEEDDSVKAFQEIKDRTISIPSWIQRLYRQKKKRNNKDFLFSSRQIIMNRARMKINFIPMAVKWIPACSVPPYARFQRYNIQGSIENSATIRWKRIPKQKNGKEIFWYFQLWFWVMQQNFKTKNMSYLLCNESFFVLMYSLQNIQLKHPIWFSE